MLFITGAVVCADGGDNAGRVGEPAYDFGSGDQHPIHLHWHTFEVTQIGHKQLSGLRKDVINVMPLEAVAVDFVADNPGDMLLHCHQQLHMDFGFMTILKYSA